MNLHGFLDISDYRVRLPHKQYPCERFPTEVAMSLRLGLPAKLGGSVLAGLESTK